MQNLIIFHQFFHKILSRNKTFTITKGQNCDVNLQEWKLDNPYRDPIKVIEYAKFGLILFTGSQDIEWKQTRNDNSGP